jgi:anti-sigma factor RsiW
MTRRRWWVRAGNRGAATPPGLSCRELTALVTDYLEDALAPGERERFEVHLSGCEHCAAYLEQLRGTIAVVGAIAPRSLSPEMERELLAAFRDWKDERA